MSAIGKILAALIAVIITAFVAGSVFAPGLTSSLLGQALGDHSDQQASTTLDQRAERITGTPYAGDVAAETDLAHAEAARLVVVRTAASAGASAALDTAKPFRVGTEGRPTLVLPARDAPYTLTQLSELAPATVSTDGPGGAFVLRQHLAVMTGATLAMTAGEHLLLAGDDSGFSSLVALGGSVDIEGTTESHAELASWDPGSGAADEVTGDGRPYLRVIGGDLTLAHTDVDGLGFLGGSTGGVAFDGRRSPVFTQNAPKAAADGVPTVTLTAAPAQHARLAISASDIRDNAVGIVVSSAKDPEIADSSVTRSLIDGVVLDRDVMGAKLTRVTSSSNARDGITVGRGSRGLILSDAVVEGNARNGMLLTGTPAPDAPIATGGTAGATGGASVTGGTFRDNARTGIDVVGGSDDTLDGIVVSGGAMGVVLDDGPRDVDIRKSSIAGAERHAISVRDGARNVRIASDDISGAAIGIYLRNAEADVRDNTVTEASIHGISLTGRLSGTIVTGNRISGTGPTAIDSGNAIAARVEGNFVDGWAASQTLQQLLTAVMQPLTIVWLLIVTLVIIALITRLGGGRRRDDPLRDPRPLQSMSRGVMSRVDAGRISR